MAPKKVQVEADDETASGDDMLPGIAETVPKGYCIETYILPAKCYLLITYI